MPWYHYGDASRYMAITFSFLASNIPRTQTRRGQPLRVHNRNQPKQDRQRRQNRIPAQRDTDFSPKDRLKYPLLLLR